MMTNALAELLSIDQEKRDQLWGQRFYAAVPSATLVALDPQIAEGPDGFSYFQLALPEADPVTSVCVSDLLDTCLDKGYGIAIFGNADRTKHPLWIFYYGMLLSYRLYGSFVGDPATPRPASQGFEALKAGKMLEGAPSETYLPACARKVIGNFMRDRLRHADPGVLLVIELAVDPKLRDPRSLMFNISREAYGGDQSRLQLALQYLSWFLPPKYSTMAMPNDGSRRKFLALA